jgi:hypothetical protein
MVSLDAVLRGEGRSQGLAEARRKRMKSKLGRRLAVLAVAVAAMLAVASPAWAETFTVTNTDDSGPGSLRQAIEDSNADPFVEDTATFAPEARGRITLASSLTVNGPLKIEGPGAEALTISGNNLVRPLWVDGNLKLSGVTVLDGRASGPNNFDNYGGAVFVENGTLNIEDSVLRNNTAAIRGGAIYNISGFVNVTNSTLSDNLAQTVNEGGGAIYNQSFFLLPCRVNVTGSTLSGNFSYNGGAIHNSKACEVNVTGGSHLDNNGAAQGGAIHNAGTLTVEDSTVSNNRTTETFGGGVYARGGSFTVRRSTFSANDTKSGGGIYAWGTDTKVHDSTFVGNRGDEVGAIEGFSDTPLTVTGSTISDNTGFISSGILNGGTLTLQGSIVAGGNTGPDVNGFSYTGGFNIVGGTAAEAGLQTDANGNPVLSDNRGPTRTVALVRGGKAIDKGNSFGSTTDQRGEARPKDYASLDNAEGGDGSDVGAFEYIDPDAASPTVEARPSPLPNGGGLNNSDVTVIMNATDEEGGSGVWRLSYSASGAQAVPEQSVPGAAAELVVSAEGETVVTYWATDRAGNRSESRTLAVRLDKTPPDTTIGSGPSGPTKSASASFGFSSTEEGVTFECSLDGGAFEACSSPKDYAALTDGNHTLEVRATDGAGNVEPTPARRTWSVDTASPNTAITSGPSGSVRSASASFRFSSPEAGATFECKLDRGAFVPCASPKSYTALANGKHAFSVRAKDRVGNVDATPASRTWTVDTIRPAVSGMSPRNASVTADTTPTIRATVRDNLTNLQKANIKLYVNGVLVSPTKYSYSRSTDVLTYNSPRIAKGKKTVRIVATDAAKNIRSTSWYFTIK